MSISGQEQLREQKRVELELAVKPLHEWLCRYGDPYMTIVVAQDRATVHQEYMTTLLSIPD